MGFTTPCFIRKNTKELRDKVYRLGGRSGTSLWDIEINTLLAAEADYFKCYDDECGNDGLLIKCGSVDCGENEALFLAISALRDDSDKNQWFTDGYHWEKCPESVADIETWRMYYKTIPHKASVEELIEHFKK